MPGRRRVDVTRVPTHPLIYEVNARAWVHERGGGTLSGVTDAELDFLSSRGVGYVWLMGVWTVGPAGLALDRALDWSRALPDAAPEDVVGSPYAVAAYEVDAALGDLGVFRSRLHARGMRLMLDFVPNHCARDAAFLAPEDLLGGEAGNGEWADTLQIDYWSQSARQKMAATLARICTVCDGIRADMAHLVLSARFQERWPHARYGGSHAAQIPEFWPAAIAGARNACRPHTLLFIAEAYGDDGVREALVRHGFDHVYDKRVYDELVGDERNYFIPSVDGIRAAVQSQPAELLRHGVHFTENHDERRAVGDRFAYWRRAEAAAGLSLCLPGARLVYHGQWANVYERLRVQLRRAGGRISRFWLRLTRVLAEDPVLRDGFFAGIVRGEGPDAWRIVAYRWVQGNQRRLVCANYTGDGPDKACASFKLEDAAGENEVVVQELMSRKEYRRDPAEVRDGQGLLVVLARWKVQIFAYESSV
eukprot:m51a1_g14169 hypothetical protein (477) ;mRNA; r:14748-16291